MRISRDLLVVVALFAALALFTIVPAMRRAEIEQAQTTFVPYSSHSAQPNGTLALQMWLDQIGFHTQRIENDTFNAPDQARVLFVFPPRQAFADFEVQALLRWVERGNTLIVASRSLSADDRLQRALQARIVPTTLSDEAELEQPLSSPTAVRVSTTSALALSRSDYVEYLSAGGSPLLVAFAQGKGKVFLTSAPFIFTNDGLRNDADAHLVRALLTDIPAGGLVAFDEFHLGYTGQQQTVQDLLYNRPWGWSIIFSLLLIFAYLSINGQRFGRVMPLPQEIARRSPAEYVQSMAQLFRRAGKRHMVMQHYHQQLKRSLGKPFRISATLPDDEFVDELSRYRDVDRPELSKTLHALAQRDAGERALVKLAAAAIRLRRRPDTGQPASSGINLAAGNKQA